MDTIICETKVRVNLDVERLMTAVTKEKDWDVEEVGLDDVVDYVQDKLLAGDYNDDETGVYTEFLEEFADEVGKQIKGCVDNFLFEEMRGRVIYPNQGRFLGY